MAKDFYKILGVEKSASQDDIKKAFRRLAHEHHPDKGGEDKKFKDINEAYQVLGDAQKRAQYDQFGSAAFEPGAGGFGGGQPGGFGFDPSGFGFNMNMEDMGDLGDVLGGMFGFGGRGNRETRGQNIEVDVTLTFLEMISGARKTISLYKQSACESCSGSGAEAGSSFTTCSVCKGKGQTEKVQRTIFGTVQVAVPCMDCQGKGKMPEKKCSACKGDGVQRREKKMEIDIPAGISEGEVLKITGEGEYPGRQGRPGDLFVRVHITQHPVFGREGNDVYSTVQVPYTTLSLGGSVDVETVDGMGQLKIPEATQGGTVFKLRGKGVPFLRSRGRGDQYVTVHPLVNKNLTHEQKKQLEELKKTGL